MSIREATKEYWELIWPIFHEITKAGKTYAYEMDTTKAEAEKIWLETLRKTFVFEEDEIILDTYYLKINQAGPGKHVCNCGYMVSASARGRELATTMCQHSQNMALGLGYKAMQFNLVASSNAGAVHFWCKPDFDIVGRLPKPFNHPTKGYVDALVLFK
ncbi:GNAT family N-acetyltransferase [Microbulbifer sp. 2205BS26-8]|uniref:GNAT family N-acetyltransferase n=1 Tax=Microbulbifer sp. 2205BS26-8 TaxID=3064386 RepID=UPI00273D7756|nr:GNAT family N-acetyltransferase [Microbulbifer sp. 2205BS26-8]MDP5210740.1 GNAT family N-acetyltransferase [Microbulbifer sp. 2205BS26-8]